jgi:hypothetical protein
MMGRGFVKQFFIFLHALGVFGYGDCLQWGKYPQQPMAVMY